MSKLVAFAAIQGGYKVVSTAEGLYKKALDTYNADTKIGFPNTAYFLPVIYSLTGMKVETLEDLKKPLEFARGLLPPHVKGKNHLPYLGPLLDAGMGAIFSYEIMEALRLLDNPDFYHPEEDPDIDAGKIWVGPADDTILRKRGVEFVDGSAPGFAAMVGAAPNPQIAKDIVEEYQRRSLYIFCAANHNGTTLIDQLLEAGVQIGWNTRIVPFGPDISSAVFALGFANRAALAFGGVQPGDYKKVLTYNKDRVFAFVNALGDIGTEWGVAAAGCVNWGFPTLADTDIPEILPTGICTYEHVVANVSHEEMCQRSVEVRGLKTIVSEIEIPCAFGPAYEGERVRGADLYAQCGGGKTQCTELVKMADMNEIEDGKVIIDGPDIEIKKGNLPSGHFHPGGRPGNAGRLRADPGTPDSPSDQLHPGHHAHRPARHRLGAYQQGRHRKGFHAQGYRCRPARQVPPGLRQDPGQGSGHPEDQKRMSTNSPKRRVPSTRCVTSGWRK
jgi:acetyl-CoA synthase